MKYARPPFPPALFKKFCKLAKKLGYTVRGHRWQLLDKLLLFADLDEHTRAMFANHGKNSSRKR